MQHYVNCNIHEDSIQMVKNHSLCLSVHFTSRDSVIKLHVIRRTVVLDQYSKYSSQSAKPAAVDVYCACLLTDLSSVTMVTRWGSSSCQDPKIYLKSVSCFGWSLRLVGLRLVLSYEVHLRAYLLSMLFSERPYCIQIWIQQY